MASSRPFLMTFNCQLGTNTQSQDGKHGRCDTFPLPLLQRSQVSSVPNKAEESGRSQDEENFYTLSVTFFTGIRGVCPNMKWHGDSLDRLLVGPSKCENISRNEQV